MKTAGFVEVINGYARSMPAKAPPIVVAHPYFGSIGLCYPGKGIVPHKGESLSFNAIVRDSNKRAIKLLRRFEDGVANFMLKDMIRWLEKDIMHFPILLGTISSYDGLIAARGNGAMQDIWMYMTALQTPVATSWYDMMNFANFSPATAPTWTAYTNAGTGGAVVNATSNGSWLTNPTGTNKKYLIGVGLSVSSVTGFTLAILYDALWGGEYSLTANATLDPTTDVAVTRYASNTPGNADYAGGNMMQMRLSATLTHTVAGTITTTYTDQNGGTGATTITIMPATGPLINRIIGNTTHNSANIISNVPFMPLTNGGKQGVTKLEQVVISGGTVSSGTVSHKIIRPLLLMPFISPSSYIEQDVTLNIGNMVELRNVSQVCGCLGWDIYSNGSSGAFMSALLRTAEG